MVPDHPDAEILEALTTAAALAARTHEVRIGHLVLNTTLRHPVALAKSLATIDVISEGRLEIGLGWGPCRRRRSASAHRRRWERTGRACWPTRSTSCRRSSEASGCRFAGRWFTLDDVRCLPAAVQQLPPLHIAGVGPRLDPAPRPGARRLVEHPGPPQRSAGRAPTARPRRAHLDPAPGGPGDGAPLGVEPAGLRPAPPAGMG